ncbi:MAG: DUF1549 domain-containing protein, partial [Planctomycetaceae bacterium]|nr:DUF1549 domain-containing protein [Planctomycetaceae bacterium]
MLRIVSAWAALVVLCRSAFVSAGDSLLFERDIRPLLSERCGRCHSDRVQKGELNVLTMSGLRKGGESGESAVGKNAEESLLWSLVADGDMPPADQPPLSPEERDLLRRWLDSGAPSHSPDDASGPDINQHDVLPIVLLRCAACHGAQQQRGGLDMRTVASMLRGGNSGPAFVPGDPDSSRMIQRIMEEACPPRELLLKFFVRRPPTAETETLKHWIQAGAPVVDVVPDAATTEPDTLVTDEDRRHWAFQPLPLPSQKSVTAIGLQQTSAAVDRLIDEQLAEHGLTRAAETDRDSLIRRAYLDLIGIPPSPEEWQQWHDDSSDGWYAAMIEHLLASPRYGERWGRYWL